MPKTIVCRSIASTYRFWFSVLGRIVRPRLDRMLRLSTSAGRSASPACSIAERAPHGVGGERLPGRDELEQLLEQPHGERVVRRVAADRDLVAADVDVAGQRLFDDPQQLVPGAEQADHGLRAGHDDLGLNGAFADGCGGHGSGRPCFLRTEMGRDYSTRAATPNSGLRARDRARAERVWPASAPVLNTSRQPDSATPSAAATADAVRCSAVSPAGSVAASSATSGWCALVITRTCVGALGLRSRNASVSVVLADHRRRELARDDRAEQAIGHGGIVRVNELRSVSVLGT